MEGRLQKIAACEISDRSVVRHVAGGQHAERHVLDQPSVKATSPLVRSPSRTLATVVYASPRAAHDRMDIGR
jgi:hypothetical protein